MIALRSPKVMKIARPSVMLVDSAGAYTSLGHWSSLGRVAVLTANARIEPTSARLRIPVRDRR